MKTNQSHGPAWRGLLLPTPWAVSHPWGGLGVPSWKRAGQQWPLQAKEPWLLLSLAPFLLLFISHPCVVMARPHRGSAKSSPPWRGHLSWARGGGQHPGAGVIFLGLLSVSDI